MNYFRKSEIPSHLAQYFIPAEIGLESTMAEYLATMVSVCRELRRVLKPSGTFWLNIGDSYARNGGTQGGDNRQLLHMENKQRRMTRIPKDSSANLKEKDLCMIPNRLAIMLQDDGWWVRSEIVWCLSGGAWVYARTAKGDMPVMIRDIARLKPGSVQLWNGYKWTPLLGMSRSARRGTEMEIVFRSGERISCTPNHRFPTSRGLVEASSLKKGDVVDTCQLPAPEAPRDCVIDADAAWFAGLYLAEGSRSDDTIQIAGHTKEVDRWENVQRIAKKFGGSATRTVTGNNQAIRVHGRLLVSLIEELVGGRTAIDKSFGPVAWRYSNAFLTAILNGYLSGDGHWDAKNGRWRLGFCRNYNLERDLRTVCARLGYHLVLRPSVSRCRGVDRPAFCGEIRMERSGHFNQRSPSEITEIRKARCREVWDLGVADEPHLFSLASGILTHNSKPNPMPESVTDRPTNCHEKIWLLTKSAKYHYDAAAIRNPPSEAFLREVADGYAGSATKDFAAGGAQQASATKSRIIEKAREKIDKQRGHGRRHAGFNDRWDALSKDEQMALLGSNARNVWTISPKPFKGAHFATFPPDLVERCILAGCPPGGLVLDSFSGSGTTAMVAARLGRRSLNFEINPDYVALARERVAAARPLQSL